MAKNSKRNKRTISPFEKSIIGSWVLSKESIHAKAVGVDQYFEDGTKNGVVSMVVDGQTEMQQFSIKTEWKIRCKRITEELVDYDDALKHMVAMNPDLNPGIEIGMKASGTIISITDAEMVIHTDGQEKATTYYRHRVN